MGQNSILACKSTFIIVVFKLWCPLFCCQNLVFRSPNDLLFFCQFFFLMFNSVLSSHDFYHCNIFIPCYSFYQHYIPNGSFIPRIALWLLVFLIISAIHLFISICFFKIWLLFYCSSYLEWILTLTDIFPNFQVNSCSLQKCWQLQKKTDTQNHSLPRVFSFFIPLFKNFLCYVQRKPEESTSGPTGHRPIKPETGSFHSPERGETELSRNVLPFLLHFLKFKNSKPHSSLVYCGSGEIKWLDCQGFKVGMMWICRSGGSQAPPSCPELREGDSGGHCWEAKAWLQNGPGCASMYVCVAVYLCVCVCMLCFVCWFFVCMFLCVHGYLFIVGVGVCGFCVYVSGVGGCFHVCLFLFVCAVVCLHVCIILCVCVCGGCCEEGG